MTIAYEQYTYAAINMYSTRDCAVYSSLSLTVSDRMVPLSMCWSLLQAKGKMVGDVSQPCLIETASQDVHLDIYS